MITRLATFGWLGDDGGARLAWVMFHGWINRPYVDPTLTSRYKFTVRPRPVFRVR